MCHFLMQMKNNNITYFNYSELKKLRKIGKGGFGEVYEGECLFTKYAFKYYDLD